MKNKTKKTAVDYYNATGGCSIEAMELAKRKGDHFPLHERFAAKKVYSRLNKID